MKIVKHKIQRKVITRDNTVALALERLEESHPYSLSDDFHDIETKRVQLRKILHLYS